MPKEDAQADRRAGHARTIAERAGSRESVRSRSRVTDVLNYSVPVTIVRQDQQIQARAIVDSKVLYFPVNADIEPDDRVERTAPNGKVTIMLITKVDVLQSPFGTPELDHTEAHFEVIPQRERVIRLSVSVPGLHPLISAAAGSLLEDGHTSKAVFEALRAVEYRVQTLSRRSGSGQPLMSQVFGGATPSLNIVTMDGRNAADEREGFKFLFMGAIAGIRNPRAHGSVREDSPEEAMEYLVLAGMLMRRLDLAEQRISTTE